jgi:hypothetical protein
MWRISKRRSAKGALGKQLRAKLGPEVVGAMLADIAEGMAAMASERRRTSCGVKRARSAMEPDAQSLERGVER